jgi:hypothetical protein
MNRTSPRTQGTSGSLLCTGAVITCPHGGHVSPATVPASNAVLLDGLPLATAAVTYLVTGCAHTVNGVPAPCTSVRWAGARDGLLVDGAPVLLDITDAYCFSAGLIPQGRPVVAPVHQGVVAG